MSILLFLVPVAFALSLVSLIAFFWASKNEQFEDLDGAPTRILDNDDSCDVSV